MMNSNWFINSVSILAQNLGIILAILVFVSWGTLLTFASLKKILGPQFTNSEQAALALGGFPLPVLLFSVSLLALRLFLPAGLILAISLLIFVISSGLALRTVWKYISSGFVLPVFIFLFLIFIRLGFLANVVLPPYFDSAEHYRLVQSLIRMDQIALSLPYYHLGYHVIIAAFTWITNANPGQVMLLFGQIILAAIPLPVYFFINRTTHSNAAGWFGVTLVAFGWFMPAHAVNWGKYPALLSMLLIQFTLGAALTKKRWLVALSMAAAVLIHSRSVILLAIFGMAWILTAVPRRKYVLLATLTGAILGLTIVLINKNQFVGLVFEPYGIWVTLLAGLLAVSVFQSFPRQIAASLLAILLMLVGMFIPITSVLTLLDRPLVEMTLFLPLAFLGGLGSIRLPKVVLLLFVTIIIFHAWTAYSFSPSACCTLVSRDDTVALDWMNKHLPANARVVISGADMSLDAYGLPIFGTGADAGIWVRPLTGRLILVLPYSTDFAAQSTHDLLCLKKATHIYVGGLSRSFQPGIVNEKPAWYETIFFLPNARIIMTLGCE